MSDLLVDPGYVKHVEVVDSGGYCGLECWYCRLMYYDLPDFDQGCTRGSSEGKPNSPAVKPKG